MTKPFPEGDKPRGYLGRLEFLKHEAESFTEPLITLYGLIVRYPIISGLQFAIGLDTLVV